MCRQSLGLAWKGPPGVRGCVSTPGPEACQDLRFVLGLAVLGASPWVIFEGPAASLGTAPTPVLKGALLRPSCQLTTSPALCQACGRAPGPR